MSETDHPDAAFWKGRADTLQADNERLRGLINHRRTTDHQGLIRATKRAETAEAAVQALTATGRAMLAVLDMQHGSMCPANTCTCDLTETVALTAASFAFV